MKRVIVYWFLGILVVGLSACQLDTPGTPDTRDSVRATIRASTTGGIAPLAVTFDASDSDGNIETFSWDFGDGTELQGEEVSHTFTDAGTFTVRLTVQDASGNDDSDTVTITVQNNGSTPNPNPEPSAVPVSAGVVLPLRRAEIEQDFSNLGVDGVYFATTQSGNTELVVTGTITQNGSGQFSYAAEPTDRLRVVFSDGLTLEYTFTVLQGDFSQPDGERFLREDHRAEYRLTTSTGTDVQVILNSVNNQYVKSVAGQVVDEGITYTVNTTTQGQIISEFGGGSVRFESEEQTTGTIESDSFSVTLDESFRFVFVAVDDAIQQSRKTMNNVWTIGGDRFELADAVIFRVFRDRFPTALTDWVATGQLTRNGQVIGGLSQEQTATSIDTVLTADGEKTILFSDRSF